MTLLHFPTVPQIIPARGRINFLAELMAAAGDPEFFGIKVRPGGGFLHVETNGFRSGWTGEVDNVAQSQTRGNQRLLHEMLLGCGTFVKAEGERGVAYEPGGNEHAVVFSDGHVIEGTAAAGVLQDLVGGSRHVKDAGL